MGNDNGGPFLDQHFSVSTIVNPCSHKLLKDKNSEVDKHAIAGY